MRKPLGRINYFLRYLYSESAKPKGDLGEAVGQPHIPLTRIVDQSVRGQNFGGGTSLKTVLVAALTGVWLLLGLNPVMAANGDAPSMQAAGPGAQPTVLSSSDAGLYRDMFALGEEGDWDAVDALAARLDDKTLMGHVLAQRYLHPTKYRTPFHELRDWLAEYNDHPQARRLYRLAQQRKPADAAAVTAPAYRQARISGGARASGMQRRNIPLRSTSFRREVRGIMRQVSANVANRRLTITEEYLERGDIAAKLRPAEMDAAYAEVAAGWYYYGNADKAFAMASRAADRSGAEVPRAKWIAGLAAWRREDPAAALGYFEKLADSGKASLWARSAGAYWAARAHLRLEQPAEVSGWLRKAAAYPHTFYGLIASEALGIQDALPLNTPLEARESVEELLEQPAGRRALALMQVGERQRARDELMGISGWDEPESAGSLLLAAEAGGLPALAFRVANQMTAHSAPDWPEASINAALYPIPPWQPAAGFQVDRALLFALMRQESAFNPRARSGAGARGLMQLMPATANYIAQRNNFSYSRAALYRPETNLDLAQLYVAYLLENGSVSGNLFKMAVAYNAGPGNLIRWERAIGREDDPLLFIESLPSTETRGFVERVFTNFWIYRKRLGQSVPSLADVAGGDWPRYLSLDRRPQEVAQR